LLLLSALAHGTVAFGSEPTEKPVLRVVYFTPNDREPIPGYVERLDKVLEHIREFYRDGMAAAGYGERTFDLDRNEDGSLRVFIVRGEHPTEKYGRQSGWVVQQECRKSLAKAGVDLQQETAVILNPLLLWEGDKAVEHGPYAGGGNHLTGFAWAYDDAMLDPDQLSSKESGGYFHRPCSIGKFNSHYIGGIAHEMGHGFGLPHVCQKKADRARGTALMGAGNHTWGREQRGEGTGTFLTAASAMQLSQHRLFAERLDQPRRRATCRLDQFDAKWQDGRLTLSGRLIADPPAHGLIVFNDNHARPSDYDAVGWTANVAEDGTFSIDVEELGPGKFQLRLMTCHVGGQKSRFAVDYMVDAQGNLDPGVFHGLMLAEAARAYSSGDRRRAQAIADSVREKNSPESNAGRKARHMLRLFEKKKLVAPSNVPNFKKSVALTDLEFDEQSVGWLRPLRDQVPVEGGGGCFLEVDGQFFEERLYAHAPSRYAVEIGGKWKRLTGSFGLQDGHPGSVVFVVRGDGKELFRSERVSDQKMRSLDIGVLDIDVLELIVENAGDGNGGDWGVWLGPQLKR
jgi:hypothetical protein